MFPGSYEFHWDVGHVVFLGAFFTVLGIVATSALVAWRSGRTRHSTLPVGWEEGFAELPVERRICRHALEDGSRVCDRHFDCRDCPRHVHAVEAVQAAPTELELYGMRWPADRRYHRGHAWARSRPDGDIEIGIDDFARRILGGERDLEAPEIGDRLQAFAPAWSLEERARAMHVLSPVDGRVVETRGEGTEAIVRVRPDSPWTQQSHLLWGAELRPWIESEMALLRRGLGTDVRGATLPDGGELVDDLPGALPDHDWSALGEDLLLNP